MGSRARGMSCCAPSRSAATASQAGLSAGSCSAWTRSRTCTSPATGSSGLGAGTSASIPQSAGSSRSSRQHAGVRATSSDKESSIGRHDILTIVAKLDAFNDCLHIRPRRGKCFASIYLWHCYCDWMDSLRKRQRPGLAYRRLGPAAPGQVDMDEARLREAKQYALKGGGAGMVIRNGFQVYSWGDEAARFDLKSTTKSIGGTALGLALSGWPAVTDRRGTTASSRLRPAARLEFIDRLARRRRPASSCDPHVRFSQDRWLRTPGLPAGNAMVVLRRWRELDCRRPDERLSRGPERAAVSQGVLAARHRAWRPRMALESLSRKQARWRDAARVRLRHRRQHGCDGPDRLPVSAGGKLGGRTTHSRELRRRTVRRPHPPFASLRGSRRGLRPGRAAALWRAVVDECRRCPRGRSGRRVLVVGPLRQPHCRHPEPGRRCGARGAEWFRRR